MDGGRFGVWGQDDTGLPCFDYRAPGAGGEGAVLPGGDPGAPWHQLGNARVTATAHAGGWTTLWATARGFVRLTPARPRRMWSLRDAAGNTLDPAADPAGIRARWTVGGAEWRLTGGAAGSPEIRRRVWTPAGDVPALRIDVTVRGGVGGLLTEAWRLTPYPLLVGALMSRPVPAPAALSASQRLRWRAMLSGTAAVRATTEGLRHALGARMRMRAAWCPELRAAVATTRRTTRPRTTPAWHDPTLPAVVVAVLDDREVDADMSGSDVALTTALTADEELVRLAVCLVDVAAGENPAETIAAAREAVPERPPLRVTIPDAPALARETLWHGAYLRGARTHDDYFGAAYVTQGSAYGFVHGLQGAPRDYALSAVPLSYLDPAAAAGVLRVMMGMTRPDGALEYAHTGFGVCTGGVIHEAPTDLPLFLLWALTDHVWATGDEAFLDERVPFYPAHAGASCSVRDRILLAWWRMRDGVGVGPHGMLRVGSGDWNDPISAVAPRRGAFHRRGESGFNTSMAAYVLPRAGALLRQTHPEDADEIDAFAAGLRRALADAWTGRWFLRGWDGTGGPIGEDHLFLDGQVWCLIGEAGSADDRRGLVTEIAAHCDEPSPVGATILDRPHDVRGGILAPGWDCNGGVWAAVNGLLAWGYARHDAELALRNLEKQTLAAHARAYPHIWYGIWSGPDSYNAHFGDRAGETFVQPATPMTEYPVMNSNAHAGPLLALLRVLGLETTPSGVVSERPAAVPGPWRVETAVGTFAGE